MLHWSLEILLSFKKKSHSGFAFRFRCLWSVFQIEQMSYKLAIGNSRFDSNIAKKSKTKQSICEFKKSQINLSIQIPTGIAEVMGSNPVQAWIFFRPYFHYCLSSAHYCEDHFHSRLYPQFKYMTFIYS